MILLRDFILGGKVIQGLHPILREVIEYADDNSIVRPQGSLLSALNRFTIREANNGNFATNDVFTNFLYNDNTLATFARICWVRLTLVDVYVATYNEILGYDGGFTNINAYIDLKWNAATDAVNYSANSAHFAAVQSRGVSGAITGLQNTNFRNNLTTSNAMNSCRLNSTSQMASAFNFTGIGFKCASRQSSAGLDVQNKGVQEFRGQLQNNITNDNQVLFRSGTGYGSIAIAMFSLGGGLTTTQMANRRANYKQYLADIGLQALSEQI